MFLWQQRMSKVCKEDNVVGTLNYRRNLVNMIFRSNQLCLYFPYSSLSCSNVIPKAIFTGYQDTQS